MEKCVSFSPQLKNLLGVITLSAALQLPGHRTNLKNVETEMNQFSKTVLTGHAKLSHVQALTGCLTWMGLLDVLKIREGSPSPALHCPPPPKKKKNPATAPPQATAGCLAGSQADHNLHSFRSPCRYAVRVKPPNLIWLTEAIAGLIACYGISSNMLPVSCGRPWLIH